MEKKYEVTLAIPVYNVESRVKNSLLSALNQTFASIEYLIIDDKGTDKSIDVVKQVIATHSRYKDVRIIDHGINRGTGATKNTAIDNARGKYIYFMDPDDYLVPTCIEYLYNKINEGVEVVAGSHVVLDEDYSFNSAIHVGDNSGGMTLNDHYYLWCNTWNTQTWNKLYSLEFLRLNNIRCIPHHLCEDVYFMFQVKLKCNRFKTVNKVTYLYIRYLSSATAGGKGYRYKFAKMYAEALVSEWLYIKKIKNLKNANNIKHEIVNQYIFLFSQIKKSSFMSVYEKDELLNLSTSQLKEMISCTEFAHFKNLRAHLVLDSQNPIDYENLRKYLPDLQFKKRNIISRVLKKIERKLSTFKDKSINYKRYITSIQ